MRNGICIGHACRYWGILMADGVILWCWAEARVEGFAPAFDGFLMCLADHIDELGCNISSH